MKASKLSLENENLQLKLENERLKGRIEGLERALYAGMKVGTHPPEPTTDPTFPLPSYPTIISGEGVIPMIESGNGPFSEAACLDSAKNAWFNS